MKILFVIAHLGKGGGQATQAIRLIKEISKNHEVKLLTLSYNSDIIDEPCETIYAGPLRFPMGALDMLKKLLSMKEKFDVVQCLDPYYALPTIFLSGKRPFFYRIGQSAKGDFSNREQFIFKLAAPFANILFAPALFSSGFTVNSEKLRQELSFYRPSVIRNGYEIGEFRSNSDSKLLRKRLGLPVDEFLLLYTGKIIAGKNIHIILESLRKVKNKLVLVGNWNEEHHGDSYFSWLKEEYKDVMAKVICTGEVHMEKVKDYLNCCDVYVFPSIRESSPNSLLEAMACRMPVICFDNPNHREIVKHGKNGLIFSTADELAAGIKELEKNRELRQMLGEEAQKFVRKNHDIKKSADEYIEMYKRAQK
ncbi:MAG: glycosyltransferase family 4 protein [archaeon]